MKKLYRHEPKPDIKLRKPLQTNLKRYLTTEVNIKAYILI